MPTQETLRLDFYFRTIFSTLFNARQCVYYHKYFLYGFHVSLLYVRLYKVQQIPEIFILLNMALLIDMPKA